MKRRAHPVITRTITLGLVVAVLSACNMAAQEEQAQQEGADYASQSQALGGGAGGSPAVTRSLEYDHHFQFEKGEIKVDITIKGEIPLTPTSSSMMVFECSGNRESDTQVRPVSQWSGNGKVNIDGTADWTASSSGCVCSLPDTIDVNIQGVEFPEWGKPVSGGSCQVYMIALKVTETWNTAPAWQCTCKTPEDVEKMHLEENLAMFSQWGNPGLEKKTMIFESECAGDQYLAEALSMFGKGDYWWTYHTGQNEGPYQWKHGPNETQWVPGMPSDPFSCPNGEWGPPLESIMAENPVPKWEPMQ
jgi:hypothetical protein